MRTRPLAQHSVARRLLRRTPSISLCPNQRAKRMQESGDSSGQLRHPCNSIRAHWDLPEWPDKHKRAARSELRACYPTGIRPGPTQADQDNPRSALSRHPTVSLRSGEQHHRWTPPARNPRRFSHLQAEDWQLQSTIQWASSHSNRRQTLLISSERRDAALQLLRNRILGARHQAVDVSDRRDDPTRAS